MVTLGFQLTFTDLLVVETLLSTMAFVALLRSQPRKRAIGSPRSTRILALLVWALTSVTLVLLMVSLVIGFRPPYFFLTCGALISSLLLLISTDGLYGNRGLVGLTLFVTTILFLVEPLVLTVGNDFYPRWEWWNDSIYVTGSLSEHMEGIKRAGLYYLVPVEGLWTVSLALITSPTHAVPAMVLIAQALAIALGAYLFAKLLHGPRSGLLMFSVLLFTLMASPGDHIITGRTVKTNPFIYLSLVYMASRQGLSRTLIPLIIVMLPMVFYHGSVVTALLSLLVPLLVLTRISESSPTGVSQVHRGTESKSIALSVVLLTLFSFTYWLFTYIAYAVFSVAKGYVDSLVNYFMAVQGGGELLGWSYVPLYYRTSYYVYSYAWAFPVGVSAALALTYFVDVLTHRRSWTMAKLHEVAAIMGLFYSATSYTAYTVGEKGQYFIPVAFFLLHIATTAAVSGILVEKKTAARLVCLTVFTAFIIVGMHSPSHAMLEHPEFESAAMIFRSTRYIEGSLVSRLISSDVTMYYDYDLPVGGGIYKTIREVLYQILSGVDPTNFYAPPYTLLAIKNSRPIAHVNMERLDLVYISDFYSILGVGK